MTPDTTDMHLLTHRHNRIVNPASLLLPHTCVFFRHYTQITKKNRNRTRDVTTGCCLLNTHMCAVAYALSLHDHTLQASAHNHTHTHKHLWQTLADSSKTATTGSLLLCNTHTRAITRASTGILVTHKHGNPTCPHGHPYLSLESSSVAHMSMRMQPPTRKQSSRVARFRNTHMCARKHNPCNGKCDYGTLT